MIRILKIAKNGWVTDVSEKKELIAYCINKDKVKINVINEQQQENNIPYAQCLLEGNNPRKHLAHYLYLIQYKNVCFNK